MEFLSVRSGVEPPLAPFGWGMKIREGPNKHKSLHEPLPLDELEEALLIGIGTGITGLNLADTPYAPRLEKTEEPVPLTMFDTYLLSAVGAEAAFIVHNIMLSEQAMALGGWILGGATSFVVMGGTPMCRGLSFRFEQTKNPQAFPVPVGIDGSFESLRPPYYENMDAPRSTRSSLRSPGPTVRSIRSPRSRRPPKTTRTLSARSRVRLKRPSRFAKRPVAISGTPSASCLRSCRRWCSTFTRRPSTSSWNSTTSTIETVPT
jgi:hypothetical protein